jgi:sigma-E factor negative regulatory protein RseB
VSRLVPVAGGVVVLAALALVLALVLPVDETAPGPGDDVARGADGTTARPVVEERARQLLERAASARATTTYAGTQFVSAWSPGGATSQVLEVTHSPSEGTTWRAAGARAGSGQVVHSAAQAAQPSILGVDAVALIAQHYSLAGAGTARVAGRETDVVEARRPGPSSTRRPVVARFWLDRASGLVLRREVYDSHGRVTRASAFVDVTVSDSGEPPAGTLADRAGRAWRETLDGGALRGLRAHGWDCPDELPGPLPLVDARRGGRHREIVHLSYADGIASISVFQQRGDLDRDHLAGYRREEVAGGAVWVRPEVPRRVVWSAGGTVYTLVADAPERTVDRAVDVLHEGANARGGDPMDRLGRGLDRVASWFNPFE